MGSPVLDVLHKWNQTPRALLRVASLKFGIPSHIHIMAVSEFRSLLWLDNHPILGAEVIFSLLNFRSHLPSSLQFKNF